MRHLGGSCHWPANQQPQLNLTVMASQHTPHSTPTITAVPQPRCQPSWTQLCDTTHPQLHDLEVMPAHCTGRMGTTLPPQLRALLLFVKWLHHKKPLSTRSYEINCCTALAAILFAAPLTLSAPVPAMLRSTLTCSLLKKQCSHEL